MVDLWECEVCSSLTPRSKVDGICSTCLRRTCPNCQRVCENCLKIFCQHHIQVKEIIRQGMIERYRLCENCRKVML